MPFLQKLLFTLSPKTVGKHLLNYLDLFIRPIRTYERILSNKKTGYEFFMLNIYYYGIFIFLLINNLATAVKFALLEVLITIIPLLIFYIPFLIFNKSKRVNWTNYFRLLVIIKMQFIPIVVFFLYLARWSSVDSIYILFENSIWLVWISFIIVLPLMTKLKIWRKLIWIFSNYLCFLTFFIILGLFGSISLDFEKLLDKFSLSTPNREYTDFYLKSNYSTFFIQDSLYFVLVRVDDSEHMYIEKTQYVSSDLTLAFSYSEANDTKRELIRMQKARQELEDSIKEIGDTVQIENDTVILYPVENELSLSKLNKIDETLRKIVSEDIKLAKQFLDSTKFETNRQYYSSLYEYLKQFEKSYSFEYVNKIANESTLEKHHYLNDKQLALLYKLDSNYYEPEKSKLAESKDRIKKLQDKSNFLQTIFIKPLELIFF